MSSLTPGAVVPAAPVCCRRPMSGIDVTTRGTTLTLHSCPACGRHVWGRDGVVADRSALLDGVQVYLDQPREPVRRPRKKKAVPV